MSEQPPVLLFLVAENPSVSAVIVEVVETAGYSVCLFNSKAAILEAALERTPSLILIGSTSSDGDSLFLLRRLERNTRCRYIRKILLSPQSSEEFKVRALELGADDYITVPFSARELIARIHAVLRPYVKQAKAHEILRLGDLTADFDAMRVWLKDQELSLTTTEFLLLTHFMRFPDRAFSRNKLLDEIWKEEKPPSDARIVDVYVRRLREKIEADPGVPRALVTKRGDGYVMVRPLRDSFTDVEV